MLELFALLIDLFLFIWRLTLMIGWIFVSIERFIAKVFRRQDL